MRTLLPLVAGIVMIASSFAVANDPPGEGDPGSNQQCKVVAKNVGGQWDVSCRPVLCENECVRTRREINGHVYYSCTNCA